MLAQCWELLGHRESLILIVWQAGEKQIGSYVGKGLGGAVYGTSFAWNAFSLFLYLILLNSPNDVDVTFSYPPAQVCVEHLRTHYYPD